MLISHGDYGLRPDCSPIFLFPTVIFPALSSPGEHGMWPMEDPIETSTAMVVPRQVSFEQRAGISIEYRTLSVHVDDPPTSSSKTAADPSDDIRQIDVHTLDIDLVFHRYSTHPTLGLESTAVERKSMHGKNIISPPPSQYWKKVLNYIFGGFNFLMWIAFIVTILSYKPLNGTPPNFILGVAILLLLVIIISTTFYAVVDWNASRVMKSINNLVADEAVVIRDGERQTVPAANIVVGDLILLSVGDRVPADMRIVQVSSDLKFDRSLLTGESDPVPGIVNPTSKNALETRNLALMSTFVVQGTCTGVVFAVGDKTIMGRIIAMSGETTFKMTTIQRELWFFTKIVSVYGLTLFIISVIVTAWLRKKYPGFETASGAIIISIGCITACVPQGLPICVALSLTIVARRMAKQNVLVKNLGTIETLGCMSVLCSDKTGTLTVGKMSLESVAFLDRCILDIQSTLANQSASIPASMKSLVEIALLCNGASFVNTDKSAPIDQRAIKGDATDTAILRFAEVFADGRHGIDVATMIESHDKLYEIPFNSKNKWMLTIIRERKVVGEKMQFGEPLMLVKGAPDVLFPACSAAVNADGSVVPFGSHAFQRVSVLQSEWSNEGQRVLALCKRSLDGINVDFNLASANDVEEMMYSQLTNLTLVGLIGITDPPRADVEEAIQVIRRAGCRVFMVTGDHQLTGVAVAKQVGIVTTEHVDSLTDMRSSAYAFVGEKPAAIKPDKNNPERAIVLAGDDIETLKQDDWNMIVGNYTEIVFSRTTPEQKLRIVEEIKARGDNIVAVTGDGVNDAPALKASHIGIAMGSGSDVAKEAAAMILLDNKLTSIPVAIELGRLVFDNLKKVALYVMPAGTYTEFAAVFTNVFLGMQLPLSSYLQVCFSITNDVVMSIPLMFEQPEIDLMQRKPRNPRTGLLTDWKFFFQIYLFIGLMMWPCAMSMWFLYMKQQGLGFYDVILVYQKWTDNYKGFTIEQLTHFVSVGQCIYYVTMVFMQYGGLLAVRNRRVSILQSNPLWGPRRNFAVPLGMIATALIAVVNLYGPGLQRVFGTAPIPGMFWALPFSFALGILCVDEARKLIVRTYPKSIIAKMAW